MTRESAFIDVGDALTVQIRWRELVDDMKEKKGLKLRLKYIFTTHKVSRFGIKNDREFDS